MCFSTWLIWIWINSLCFEILFIPRFKEEIVQFDKCLFATQNSHRIFFQTKVNHKETKHKCWFRSQLASQIASSHKLNVEKFFLGRKNTCASVHLFIHGHVHHQTLLWSKIKLNYATSQVKLCSSFAYLNNVGLYPGSNTARRRKCPVEVQKLSQRWSWNWKQAVAAAAAAGRHRNSALIYRLLLKMKIMIGRTLRSLQSVLYLLSLRFKFVSVCVWERNERL